MSSWGVMAENLGWGIVEEGWRKGPWTAEEDRQLIEYVKSHGEGRWNCVSRFAGLKRNGKSCRLRWVNYLRPDLKRGQITPHEESIIQELHARWGNRWSTIARSLPGRTDNEIKNYWRTHFKKKGKLSVEDAGKSRARILKRQQFQQQQRQQQQQQQQHEQNQVEMKTFMSLIDESTDYYRVPSLPQVMIKQQDIATAPQVNSSSAEEQGFYYYYSMFNNYNNIYMSPQKEASNSEDILWDAGLWNLEDVQGQYCASTSAAVATAGVGLQSLATPFF